MFLSDGNGGQFSYFNSSDNECPVLERVVAFQLWKLLRFMHFQARRLIPLTNLRFRQFQCYYMIAI